MWNSGAYSLSILIAAFSGIWPYVKLLLLGACWVIPMKQPHREAIIIVLDQMGKFSFIDLFVSLYMIVSFYVEITEQLKGYGVDVKIVVEPDVGLNTFVIGTALSMLFSHFFLFLDAHYAKPHVAHLRRLRDLNDDDDAKRAINEQRGGAEPEIAVIDDEAMKHKMTKITEEMEAERALMVKHQWNTVRRPLCIRFAPHSICGVVVRSLMLMVLIATMWGVIDSVFTAPVRYDIEGLVGWALTDSHRAYSPWQIVVGVPSHTDEHEAAPALSFALFVTIIVFPILLVATMMAIWMLPVLCRRLHFLNIAMQTFMAWTALDVFAVASIAASLELDRVSQWIMNQTYPKICGPEGIIPLILEKVLGRETGCFAVTGHLTWGIWIVVGSAVSMWFLFVYTIHQLQRSNQQLKRLVDGGKGSAGKSIFFFDH